MAEDVKSEVLNFLEKCDDLKCCKFIMAPTKIKELLKSIAASRELCRFFYDLTNNFDFNAAKNNCFVCLTDGITKKNRLVLPNEGDFRLAFTFCLLVEIDRGIINFDDLLERYFYVDGSYYSSFQMFTDDIIMPMATIVRQCYTAVLSGSDSAKKDTAGDFSDTFTRISLTVAAEKLNISNSEIPLEDRESGKIMLTEIENAVRRLDFNSASAILCGYNYYLQYYGTDSEDFRKLIALIREYSKRQ
ncbi:MAG: hypothetical protein LUD29_06670 [Clostridia bacterium]|nr:hypothetical protein [Clostridia bacterium]